MKKLKKLTTKDIPTYGLGTWLMGGDKDRDPNNDDQKDIEAIKMHLDNGVNQIFTAQNYAEGWAEKIVGSAIKGYDRSKIVLNTAVREEMSAYKDVFKAVEGSLERLETDYIDVIVHHAPIPEVPVKETIKALNEVVDKGLARGIAVSNYNSKSIQEAIEATKHPILFNQVYYNLFVREVEEEEVLELCRENNILIQAYRPLELGELAKPGTSKLLDKIAKTYNATPAQIALSYLTSQKDIVLICTTHNPEHLKSNLEGIKIKLDKKDFEELKNNFPTKELEKNFIR